MDVVAENSYKDLKRHIIDQHPTGEKGRMSICTNLG